MNTPLRHVAIALFVLFALLFVNLNYIQYVRGDALRTDSLNRRVLLHEYQRQRGTIVVDGAAIASSQETNGRLKYLRTYPSGNLYSHVTGFKSVLYGETGIEAAENSVLSGDDDRLFVRRLAEIIRAQEVRGANVVLTLNHHVQQTAFNALSGQKGAIVALDPRTGAILSLASGPTYDPNLLSSHDTSVEQEAWETYNADAAKPMLNRALNESYPPGSTFKVVLSAAALKQGYSPSTQVESPLSYTPPQTTQAIQNYGGSSCGGESVTLEQALTVSCNTSFAMLGVNMGADAVRKQARAFGFEDRELRCPIRVSPSTLGSMNDPPSLAQSSIGQRDVRMTPLEGAMIASAVANNGELMSPYLVREIQAPNLSVLSKTQPDVYSHPLNGEQARALQQMMNSVVNRGTGTAAQISGVTVGGKTGTAEDGDFRQDHGWFIGYAMENGAPLVAVAVVLENTQTSSSEAARIAGTVMQAVVAQRGNQ